MSLIEKSYLEKEAWVVWKIARPESLNALNSQVLLELDQALDELLQSPPRPCAGLLLSGVGEKAFVAGADIKEMLPLNQEQALQFSQKGQAVFNRLALLPFPVIAVVSGFALGGGLELALACDWIYAAKTASFALPEVSLSLIPGFGGTARLVQKIGLARALELTLSGQRIAAEQALQWGLVNQVWEPEQLWDQTLAAIKKQKEMGPRAVAQAKRLIYKNQAEWLATALEDEADSFGDLFNLKDVREGLTAFTEKRKAQYRGE